MVTAIRSITCQGGVDRLAENPRIAMQCRTRAGLIGVIPAKNDIWHHADRKPKDLTHSFMVFTCSAMTLANGSW